MRYKSNRDEKVLSLGSGNALKLNLNPEESEPSQHHQTVPRTSHAVPHLHRDLTMQVGRPIGVSIQKGETNRGSCKLNNVGCNLGR